MARARGGIPVKLNGDSSRGDSRGAVALATRHRAVALLAQTFEVLESDRDFVAALAREARDAPLTFLERVNKLCGGDDKAANEGNVFNFNGLFAGAAAVAAQRQGDGAVVIDGELGVQSGYDGPQPIDW